MKRYLERLKPKGQCPPRKPWHKIAWSWLGSFLGIYLFCLLGAQLKRLTGVDAFFLIGSFAASAVLIYGLPTADLAQPRNVVGGHVISAVVGVAVWRLCPHEGGLALPSALAVSLAIVAMHATRTLHPPGGATALIAVIGGGQVHALGFKYVVAPVLVTALALLAVALVVNNLSGDPKRHYPAYWY